MKHFFFPTEIIFSATTACNLHCPHCFVSRSPVKLEITAAKNFLKNCINEAESNSNLPRIEKIGFTGGEPFLFLDFICELTKTALENDLLFDQIMTNGDWWKDEKELETALRKVYDAGYDGKIGVSYDSFHGQSETRMNTFICAVEKIFGENSVVIQRVEEDRSRIRSGMTNSQNGMTNSQINLKARVIYNLPQTFPALSPLAWQSKHWFKKDYCEGPGNILYIHANGQIAPCCGFANENEKLFIGTINDSLETIMQNAQNNKMIQLCFSKGLHTQIHKAKKILPAEFKKIPCTGKTSDICTFCDFICKSNLSF